MFIRMKNIKGQEYAYLVENSWKDSKARQRVRQYLGRVYTPEKIKTVLFEEFCKMPKDYKGIVSALIGWTLVQHGFVKDPLVQKKWLYDNGRLVCDPEACKITSRKNNVTLKLNEGYMNEYTLKELLNINIKKQEQRDAATVLAKAFVSAGIPIPENIFIEVFQKVHT